MINQTKHFFSVLKLLKSCINVRKREYTNNSAFKWALDELRSYTLSEHCAIDEQQRFKI